MPAKASVITALGYALLGLVHGKAQSGYALRKVFETTPLGNYSSSPGSIYPALKNLQKAGLVEQRPDAAGKNVFAMTPAGEAALNDWLARPVTGDDFARDMGTLLLRFALLQGHPDRRLTLDFLRSFEAAGRLQVAGLQAFIDSELCRSLPLQSRLAVDHGLRGAQASTQWATNALSALLSEGETKS